MNYWGIEGWRIYIVKLRLFDGFKKKLKVLNRMNNLFVIGKRRQQHYADLLIKANWGLHMLVAELVKKKTKPGAKILDLGAGEGSLSERLKDLGYHVVSVDMNIEGFGSKSVEFYQLNFDKREEIEKFKIKYDEYFDLVLSIEVIEHVENQWEFVRLLKAVLKKDGFLIITTPNITSWLSRFIFFFTGRFFHFEDSAVSYGHISPISPWELELIIHKEGFSEIEITTGVSLPLLWITKNILMDLAYILFPFYRFFMKGHYCRDNILVSAKK